MDGGKPINTNADRQTDRQTSRQAEERQTGRVRQAGANGHRRTGRRTGTSRVSKDSRAQTGWSDRRRHSQTGVKKKFQHISSKPVRQTDTDKLANNQTKRHGAQSGGDCRRHRHT